MDYDRKTDTELLNLVAQNDDGATDFLVRKYGAMVRRESRAWFLIGGDADDVYQEGMIGLFKAVRDYKSTRGSSFPTFALLCIRNQIKTAINNSRRQKHTPLNEYISIYADDPERGGTLAEDLEAELTANPEELLLSRERLDDLENGIRASLTPREKKVLKGYLAGYSYGDIAEKLGCTEKSVDNALQRIRTKLRGCLQDE